MGAWNLFPPIICAIIFIPNFEAGFLSFESDILFLVVINQLVFYLRYCLENYRASRPKISSLDLIIDFFFTFRRENTWMAYFLINIWSYPFDMNHNQSIWRLVKVQCNWMIHITSHVTFLSLIQINILQNFQSYSTIFSEQVVFSWMTSSQTMVV